MSEIIGGGVKKNLYTLSTVEQIGLKQSANALTAKNTCKAWSVISQYNDGSNCSNGMFFRGLDLK